MSRIANVEDCIWKAAEALLYRDGPAFSMDALARKAGVSRATLYRHLRGRRQLSELIASARRPPARERLIAAASDLLVTRGLHGFSLEDVAASAGVSATTLYREFHDRTELLRAVIETVAPAQALVAILADPKAHPERVLTAFVSALLRRLEEQPAFLRLVLLGDAAQVAELRKLRRTRAGVSHALTQYLEAQVRAGRLRPYPVTRLTASLLGLVLGSRVTDRLMGDALAVPFEESAAGIVQMFLTGAKAEEHKR